MGNNVIKNVAALGGRRGSFPPEFVWIKCPQLELYVITEAWFNYDQAPTIKLDPICSHPNKHATAATA